MRRFQVKDYQTELIKELKARQRIWQNVQGMPERFINPQQQRRYDVLNELLDILSYCPIQVFERLRDSAESARDIVQTSMFNEDDKEN